MAIYSWQGCQIQITLPLNVKASELLSDYIAGDTPMESYLNTHLGLEQMRDQFEKTLDQMGPRVMILGPPDSGKSSLSKILLNYAVKASRAPLFVDLDTNEVSNLDDGTPWKKLYQSKNCH